MRESSCSNQISNVFHFTTNQSIDLQKSSGCGQKGGIVVYIYI